MSLIVNAADSFEGGTGRIWVNTAQVDAGVEPFVCRFEQEPVDRGVFGMVEVRDSGSGISRDVMGQIFDPFFSTRSLGRGLGLTAVHGIVKAHHGALDVQSVPGEGTTVRVYFPRSRP
jgi:signal transduction histidine kinase